MAEAVVRIGQAMSATERRSWYQTVYPALLAYHEWLYRERDPHGEGLVLQIHPWEIGLDNTPPWMLELHEHQMPLWIRVIGKLHADKLINNLRRDTHFVAPGQRLSSLDALAYFSIQRRLRRKAYDIDKVLSHAMLAIEDLSFNCIFIRANHNLRAIAKAIRRPLPDGMRERMDKTEAALEQLWEAYTGQYYSRNFVTHKLLTEPSIATLLPLYAGSITKERAEQLVAKLHDKKLFGAPFPVPSVPLNSFWFRPHLYWQGPTWLNMNWLIIDGLRRYGYVKEAELIIERSCELVAKHGFYEYFSPIDGTPAGSPDFSWSAAVIIDLLQGTKVTDASP